MKVNVGLNISRNYNSVKIELLEAEIDSLEDSQQLLDKIQEQIDIRFNKIDQRSKGK